MVVISNTYSRRDPKESYSHTESSIFNLTGKQVTTVSNIYHQSCRDRFSQRMLRVMHLGAFSELHFHQHSNVSAYCPSRPSRQLAAIPRFLSLKFPQTALGLSQASENAPKDMSEADIDKVKEDGTVKW